MKEKKINPTVYKIITILAIVWNAYGVLYYFYEITMTDEQLNSLSPAEKDMIINSPSWSVAAFAITVWFGLLGAILLCLKHRLTIIAFIISIIGLSFTFYYTISFNDSITKYGYSCIYKLSFTLIFHVFLIFYTYKLLKIKFIGKEF